jgi:uncharacterized protein (TIGR02246 family)
MKLFACIALCTSLAFAIDSDDVKAVLKEQELAWNRGDLARFLTAYEQSPEITFVGTAVTRGFDAIRRRYESNYGSPAKMGTLTFDELEVRMLGKQHALLIGRFRLKRTAEGGGDAMGRFTLVAAKRGRTWKFLHDHTSSPAN